MSFVYPLCLIALLGIPAIILIYILKSQYTEQTVNSTYIWTLSEKFLKRRNPLNGLTGIIALILQLLMILLITLALTQPLFIQKGKAKEYCFVIDASESMNMQDGKSTRFERAKDEIEKIISSSKKGSEYTLIYASDEATTIYDGLKDKKNAIKLLEELEPAQLGANTADAMLVAQEHFNQNTGLLTYLVTDKTYLTRQNIEIINVSRSESNASIRDLTCEMRTEANGVTNIYASALLNSYGKNSALKLSLYIDNNEKPSFSMNYTVPQAQDYPVSFPPVKLESPSYSRVRAVIETEDALADDNEVVCYNIKNEKQYKTIIVSERPFFFQAIIKSLGDYDIASVTPEEYEKTYSSSAFGLYIFDSYTPKTLPKNGAIWMINSNQSLEGTGFSYRSENQMVEPVRFDKSTSSQTAIRKLLDGYITKDIYAIRYLRYSTYTDYMTLLSCDGVPVLMAGENSYGNRMVVFAFDIHDSNIALTGDFVNLAGNLLDYSFPSVLDSTSYVAGDEIIINTVAGAESVKLVSPSGENKYLDTEKTMNTVVLNEVGTYTVEVVAGGSKRVHNFFSQIQAEESAPSANDHNISIIGQASKKGLDAEFDPAIIIFILIILTFAADWMVYMYEKRQLR